VHVRYKASQMTLEGVEAVFVGGGGGGLIWQMGNCNDRRRRRRGTKNF